MVGIVEVVLPADAMSGTMSTALVTPDSTGADMEAAMLDSFDCISGKVSFGSGEILNQTIPITLR